MADPQPTEGQTGQVGPHIQQQQQQQGFTYIPASFAQPAVSGGIAYPMSTYAQSTPIQMVPQHGMAVHIVQPGMGQTQPTYVYAQPAPAVGTMSHAALDHTFTGCCGCHVKTCVFIIGILEAIGLIISLIASIVFYSASNYYYNYVEYADMIVCIVSFVFGAIVLACLFYGVQRERGGWLLPHIVFQSIAIVGLFIGVILYIVAVAEVGYVTTVASYDYSAVLAVEVVILIILLIAAIVEICFMVQVIKCYRYFNLKHHGIRW